MHFVSYSLFLFTLSLSFDFGVITHASANEATAYADKAGSVASAVSTQINRVIVSRSGFVEIYDDKLQACSGEFFGGAAPRLIGSRGLKLAADTYPLCFHGFGTLYSGVSRTAFWSASHLTDSRIREARTLARTNSFRTEMRIPAQHRSELADYRRSGFDRGHIAPNGDMATLDQQYDSFSLANIAPQNHEHNRNIWQHIEITTRNLTMRYGEAYVVTGVAFNAPTVERIGGRVMVPSHFFKAVYIPKISAAGVYYSPNNAAGGYEVISLHELKNRTGIDAMPALPASIQNQAYQLPNPSRSRELGGSLDTISDGDINLPQLDFSKEGWLSLVVGIFKYLVEFINKA